MSGELHSKRAARTLAPSLVGMSPRLSLIALVLLGGFAATSMAQTIIKPSDLPKSPQGGTVMAAPMQQGGAPGAARPAMLPSGQPINAGLVPQAPSGYMPQSAVPAVGAASDTTQSPGAVIQSVTGGKAPTIDMLSNAQRADLKADIEKRLAKSMAITNPSPAPTTMAPVGTFTPAPVIKLPPPDITKKVVAIYGPVGREIAEIRMPSGDVVIAKAGSTVGGFEVLRVSSSAVEFVAPAKPSRAVHRSAHYVAPQGDGQAFPKVHHVVKHVSPAAESTPMADSVKTIRVAVGGTFK